MGHCQILALTKFNLQAVICPFSTCLLLKTLNEEIYLIGFPESNLE